MKVDFTSRVKARADIACCHQIGTYVIDFRADSDSMSQIRRLFGALETCGNRGNGARIESPLHLDELHGSVPHVHHQRDPGSA